MGAWLVVAVAGGLAVAIAVALARRRWTARVRAHRVRVTPAPAAAPAAVPVDEDVQFTVYRPVVVVPGHWYPLLAFAHRTQAVVDDEGETVDPVAEVARQAATLLGADRPRFGPVREDSAAALPRGGEITFVPVLPGCEVNPPSRSFRWTEPVHREEFRIRADPAHADRTVHGHVAVYQGAALVAEVNVTLRVGAEAPVDAPIEAVSARRFDRVFMSYSHLDGAVVDLVEALNLDAEYLRDCHALRAGEDWSARLEELITEADRFQLFWSRNAMASEQVAREWRYALALGRAGFVRPVYWETPRPTDPARGLPPEELDRLHFQFLDFGPADRLAPRPVPVTATAPPGQATGRDQGHRRWAPGRRRGLRLPVVAAGLAAAAAAVVATAVGLGGGSGGPAIGPTLTTADTGTPPPVETTTPPPGTDSVPQGPGDDPALDQLTSACRDGALASCDALFRQAAPRTEYATTGTTCGEASILRFAGTCARFFSPALEQLANDCTGGDPSACPRLAVAAPPGSPYQRLAASKVTAPG